MFSGIRLNNITQSTNNKNKTVKIAITQDNWKVIELTRLACRRHPWGIYWKNYNYATEHGGDGGMSNNMNE